MALRSLPPSKQGRREDDDDKSRRRRMLEKGKEPTTYILRPQHIWWE
jgi:hypothetical protein